MAIASRHEGSNTVSEINVTPMVDVMLVLLIIFMLVTPMLNNKVNVTLAEAKSAVAMPDAIKSDAVKVSITRDGRVYLGATQLALSDLGPQAQDLLQNKADKTVYIRSDARAHYGIVMDAIDSLRTAGVDEVAFLTEPPKTAPAAPAQKKPGAPAPAPGT